MTARRRPVIPGIFVLGISAAFTFRWMSPTYVVKGSWQGEPGALVEPGAVIEGLEPKVKFPTISYSRNGLGFSVKDGRLNAEYSKNLDEDTALKLHVNDEQSWRAALTSNDASAQVTGEGTDLGTLTWSASQRRHVDNVGDVSVEFNSDKEYNLTMDHRNFTNIGGAYLAAKVRATVDGVAGRLDVNRKFSRGAEAAYSVQNSAGEYEPANLRHSAKFSAPFANGNAVVSAQGDVTSQRYETSYTRPIRKGKVAVRVQQQSGGPLGYNASYAHVLPRKLPVDGDVLAGVDEDGAYARFAARRALAHGIKAEYEATGRVGGFDDEQGPELRHVATVSKGVGYAQVSHARGSPPNIRIGYDFDA